MILIYFVLLGLVSHSLGGEEKPSKCQPQEPKCGKNEVYVVDSNACRKTCANRDTVDSPCAGACKPYTGCVCKNGYVRRNDDATGPCVKPKKCQPKCGKNEVYVVDSNACRKTCANRDTVDSPCAGACKPYTGCVCKNGYVRRNDDATGPCVKPKKCPKAPCPPKCGVNEVYKKERTKCPPQTCKSLYIKYRCAPSDPEPGCDCIDGYLRNDNGTCIPTKKCPKLPQLPTCGENEVATANRIVCPPQTCESRYTLYKCVTNLPPEAGCDCIKGYLRDKSGKCIPSEKCPGPQPVCGENEVATDKKYSCPPETCDIIYTSYLCADNQTPEPGCNCIDGYLRNENGDCIPTDQCPIQQEEECGYNEVWSQTKLNCPPQNCESLYVDYPCAYFPPQPGCVCIDNHLRNETGICIPQEECPGPPKLPGGDPDPEPEPEPGCGPNSKLKKCPNPCPPTCDNPNPVGACYKACVKTGCECNEGYLWHDNKCILPKDCPGCGSNSTFKKCPNPCPPTCDNPNPVGQCAMACQETGCECNKGYLWHDNKCILPKDCPGGVKCPDNEQYVNCKIDCPNNYCRVNDFRGILICDPAYPCPGGCVCKPGYLRKSSNDKQCIEAPKCPPVNCTRPNEVWNPNPPKCIRDRCEDAQNPQTSDTCNQPNRDLRPQCVCRDGYYRNRSDICVPAKECPFICPISAECRPTCAVPNPKNCPAVEPAKLNIDGCQCQEGYILSEAEGKCIRINECPQNQGCNGDPNAVVRSCARDCPSTCIKPNARMCSLKCSVGCECAPGYILSEDNGKCIKIDDCPGGNPCGQNATLVGCAIRCPNQYCPKDNRMVFYGCDPPYPCPSGCACKNGYKRLNTEDRCVLASDCPFICPVDEQCRPTCTNPTVPKYCPPVKPAKANIDGCQCEAGYILSEANGKCIRVYECPQNQSCDGDPNAVITSGRWPCRGTCAQPSTANCDKPITFGNDNYGCECREGYILSKENGKCIKIEKCPGGDPCAPNSTYSTFINSCPGQYCLRELPRVWYPCDPVWPTPAGCVCKSGYLRLYDGDNRCVLSTDCPPVCPIYEECRPTCANPKPGLSEFCTEVEPSKTNVDGCQCQDGYILESPGGKCIKIEECPQDQGCGGDPHAIVKHCPSSCPPTCADPNNRCVNKRCSPPGCECAPGYILSEPNGQCILPGDCKGGDPCGANATFSSCSYKCPENYCPQDDSNGPVCDPPYPCPPGCMCKINHRRLSYDDDRCIMSSDCPPVNCKRQNEVWAPCPSDCRSEYCESVNDPPVVCNTLLLNCQPKCVCADGFFRNSTTGLCVPREECANYNNPCKSKCTPTCTEPKPLCEVAPDKRCCKPGYILSERGGHCIKIEDCPKCPNNHTDSCLSKCTPTCAEPKPLCEVAPDKRCCKPGYILSERGGHCIKIEDCPKCPNNHTDSCLSKCTPTCAEPKPLCEVAPDKRCCKPGYILSERGGHCIKIEDCPKCPNNHTDSCLSKCTPTCAEPKPLCEVAPDKRCCKPGYILSERGGHCIKIEDCPTNHNDSCSSKCTPTCAKPNPLCEVAPDKRCCEAGYILSERGGRCIKINECPRNIGCNGDPNAVVKSCPAPCPANCDNPKNQPCKRACLEVGCECAPGYLRSKAGGNCIKATDCPGGDPCGPNGTYVSCSFRCPDQYCPKTDSRFQVACMPPYNCPPGCACKLNHKRLSTEDDRCILAPDCPPVKCTRPNEVWSSCPSACLREDCRDINDQPSVCNTLVWNCNPRCICADGHFRNKSGYCVPAKECEGYVDPCNSKCAPTCAEPNPPNCDKPVTGCCGSGYILSERGGKCVKIEECPKNIGCSGDPHAEIKTCPSACPSTCDKPDTKPCPKICLAVGCECSSGYIRSTVDGKCILPSECPYGCPDCGPNGTYVDCAFRCPNQYCPKDDSQIKVACKPGRPCPPGCGCKPNYKRLSYDDDRCILATDCPPVTCKRPNEVWSPCPKCLAESCKNVNDPPNVCNTEEESCEPACVCVDGHYRNSNGTCVPAKECEGYVDPCNSKCAPTCAEPNPPNCDKPVTGCCGIGYILSERGGKCVKIEECPREIGCNGDPHAEIKTCPSACPSTCDKPDTIPCPRICLAVGCECSSGYIRSTVDGKCILPNECPYGCPNCGPNGTYVDCAFRCPNQYCPEDDSLIKVACKPGRPCPPGCGCKPNYKRLSYDDDRCILATDCPPVTCTRPNEKWSPCPKCLAESCTNVNDPPSVCNIEEDCEPACVCDDGYYRNNDGTCVPAEECEGYDPCKSKCAPTCAQPNPPNCPYLKQKTCCESGYILSEWGGECIKIEDCPRNGCNGDSNAIVKECPTPCPSTCDSPNAIPCRKACLAVGCECAPGYLWSKHGGKCIKPDQCPGGNPCPKNEVFVPCKAGCPTDYCPVDDNSALIACSPPFPCLSGCICRVNHRRKSYDDQRCIVASDCPPVECTRQNEKWDSCPSACLKESCSDVGKKPVTCNTLVLNCQPRCVCSKNTYRNASGICVPPCEC